LYKYYNVWGEENRDSRILRIERAEGKVEASEIFFETFGQLSAGSALSAPRRGIFDFAPGCSAKTHAEQGEKALEFLDQYRSRR
jgi:hypothetical protein